MNIRLALTSLLLLSACGDDTTPVDGGTGTDVPTAMDVVGTDTPGLDSGSDGGEDVPATGDSGTDGGTANCGEMIPDVSSIMGTEGIAIGPDGTIYYSQSGGIGRMQPGMAAESSWITGLGGTMWGLAYRDSDNTLFAASPAAADGTIYRVDPTAGSAVPWVTDAGAPNGLIVTDDGTVLFSDFGGGIVYRANEDGTTTAVTTSAIAQANGLLMDDDGTLLVLSYATGDIFRITLDGSGVEASRVTAGMVAGGNLDGIAKDVTGRFYVTNQAGGSLLRLDADLSNPESLLTGVSGVANVAFGRGALDCNQVFVTSGGAMQVFDAGSAGRP